MKYIAMLLMALCASMTMAQEARWYESIDMNAFVSVAYSNNFNNPSDGQNGFRVFDFDHNSIKVDVAELSFAKRAIEVNQAGFRVDIVGGNSIPQISGSTGSILPKDNIDLQQMYLTWVAPVGSGLTIDAGKFLTHMGYELIDGYDGYNDNYSRSFLFGYAIPFSHTGLRASYAFSETVSMMLMIANGWDNPVDNNASKTVGAQIVLSPGSDAKIYLNAVFGPEQNNNNRDNRTVVDLVGIFPLSEKVTLGINADYGNEADLKGPGEAAAWYGAALYAKAQFTELFSLAFRAELFDDKDGVRTGIKQKLTGFTLTPALNLADGIVLRTDLRYDSSSELVFNKEGKMEKSQLTLGMNLLFAF